MLHGSRREPGSPSVVGGCLNNRGMEEGFTSSVAKLPGWTFVFLHGLTVTVSMSFSIKNVFVVQSKIYLKKQFELFNKDTDNGSTKERNHHVCRFQFLFFNNLIK